MGGRPQSDNPGNPPADGYQVRDGIPPPQPRVKTARGQEGGDDRPCEPTARRQSQGEGGEPPARQHALLAYGMPNQEGGNPPSQADEQAD